MQSRVGLVLLFITLFNRLNAQNNPVKDTVAANFINKDSVTLKANTYQSALTDEVVYESYDSIWNYLNTKEIHLYKNVKIKYGSIEITAGYVKINFENSTISAFPIADSLGKMVQKPVFKDGDETYTCGDMVYNFKSKKAFITEVVTLQDQNFLLAEKVKLINDKEAFIKNGKYTTCNNTDHPHFYLNISKAKTIKDDKIVAGPSYFVVEDVPLPIGLPFALIPAKKGKRSGILVPTYGNSPTLGYFLRDFGYYIPINNNFDLKLNGDIYSLGSWRFRASSSYIKKYKFNGNFSLQFSNTRFGEKGDLDFQSSRDFLINWTYNQDPKANPNARFSANVNAGSSRFLANNSFSTNAFLNNNLNSSITWNKQFANKPYSLNVTANHSQNTQTRQVSLVLPNATFVVNRIFPFARKNQIGNVRWYEKLGISYTGNAQAQLSGTDSLIFKNNIAQRINKGVQHTIPISTSFNLLKYITVAPSINYRSFWYFTKNERIWNPTTNQVVTDTLNGFYTLHEYSANLNMNTRLYGTFQFKKGKLSAIRHSINPSLGINWRPDFGKVRYGYYDRVQTDSVGRFTDYAFFQNTLFGIPGRGKQAGISYGIDNILEAKWIAKTDSGKTVKKIKIFDSFSLNGSYNAAADSLRLSPVLINGRTNFTSNLSMLFGATYNPYLRNTTNGQTINTLALYSGKLLKLERYFFTLSGSLRPKSKTKQNSVAPDGNWANWVDFNLPYNLTFNYNIQVNKPLTATAPKNTVQVLTTNGDINITPNWKVGFNTGYDFTNKRLTPTVLNFYRDLHCWEMALTIVPFGFNQSYTFTINAKAQALRDLRLQRRRDWFDFR